MPDAGLSVPVAPRDAATILLVRDAPAGLEVFLLVRHARLDFASGAMVFPGGAVDESDRPPDLREHIPASHAGLGDQALALRVAGIREAYEECGVLLARELGARNVIGAVRLSDIDIHYAGPRARHELDLGLVARREGLELAVDLLVPFAHWITPETQPKRYDTHFYVARAPDDHIAIHDGHESVDSAWMTPARVLAEADEDRWQVMFPTRMNLARLGASATVDEALAAAAASEVVTVMPKARRVEGGRRLDIPLEAGYGVSAVLVDERGNVTALEQ